MLHAGVNHLICTNKKQTTKSELFLKILSSPAFRAVFILCGFMALVLYRRLTGSFGVSLGYLYIFLIVLAGLWFGIKGGVGAALVAILIHLVEIGVCKHFPNWDLACANLAFRFIAYLTGGLSIGYFSQLERQLKERLNHLAHYDGLTGCLNHPFTMELLEREIARANRHRKEFSLAMIDMDHFKQVNDRYGHLVGNEVLKIFAETVKSNLRQIDIAGRCGGDEFLIILPDTQPEQSKIILNRIQEKFTQVRPKLMEGEETASLSLSFSAGIASFPRHGNTMHGLLKAVDDALYQAKRNGKNRIFLERRKQRRLKPRAALKVELYRVSEQGRAFSPSIVNISTDGMLASFPADIALGDFLCKLSLPEQVLSAEFPCSAIHKRKREDETCDVGIIFQDITPAVHQKLQELAVASTC